MSEKCCKEEEPEYATPEKDDHFWTWVIGATLIVIIFWITLGCLVYHAGYNEGKIFAYKDVEKMLDVKLTKLKELK